jgi:ABC-type multidrug transport system ATPase subunit
MSEILRLKSVGLAAHGPVLTLSLARGQSVAIIGPAASGKSRLLKFLGAKEAPPTGQLELTAKPHWPTAPKDKKQTPQQMARTGSQPGQINRATDALNAFHLWEHRQTPVGDLSTSQAIACELLSVLACDDGLMCTDCHLDHLDPWTLRSAFELIRKRLAGGLSAAIVTNRPDVVAQCDLVVAVNRGEVRHAGRVQDLGKKVKHEIEVVSEKQAGVRALVEPFAIDVHEKGDSLYLHAQDGQQVAAKLLLEGYGDVKYIVHRQPTIEECLVGLI